LNAIILAAGQGKRLGGEFRGQPKSLIKINSKTLLERIVFGLSNIGVKNIEIVTGFESHQFQRDIERYPIDVISQIRLIENQEFKNLGSFYSLFLALQHFSSQGVWIFDSDIIFDKKLFSTMLTYDYSSSAICCTELTDNPDKVLATINQNKVTQIGKPTRVGFPADKKLLEYIGVLYLDVAAVKILKDLDSSFFVEEYENVINELLYSMNFTVINLGNMRWNEIDTMEDYQNVLEFWK